MNINCDMQTVIALKPNLTEQTLPIINQVKLEIMFLPGYGQIAIIPSPLFRDNVLLPNIKMLLGAP